MILMARTAFMRDMAVLIDLHKVVGRNRFSELVRSPPTSVRWHAACWMRSADVP